MNRRTLSGSVGTMSDKRQAPENPERAPDSVEESIRQERQVRGELPYAVVMATAMQVQPIQLGDGSPGIGLELSNPIFKVPFPMDLAQARDHINNLERSMLEARVMAEGPTSVDR
jgi:hypothetical protein